MSKYSAEQLSLAGDQFLGRAYSEMDCQEFVERCLQAIGLVIDLKGSNAWFRKMTWTGTPEECMKLFGCVPTGAFLFIWDNNGSEVARGYTDGKGNASHIGIVTHRNDGAIHSSASRGCVATSKFQDKTIKNGGWNRVGLWDRMDYGKTVNWLLEHMGIGSAPAEETKEDKPMTAIVTGPNGETVNLRESYSTKSGRIMKVPDGTSAEILDTHGDWSKVKVLGKTGWMMSEYLVADDSGTPDEEFDSGDLNADDGEKVTLTFTAGELRAMLPYLDMITDKIAAKVGRG